MYEYRSIPPPKINISVKKNKAEGVETFKIDFDLDGFHLHDIAYLEGCIGEWYAERQSQDKFEQLMVYRLDHIKEIRDKFRLAIDEAKVFNIEDYRGYDDKDKS